MLHNKVLHYENMVIKCMTDIEHFEETHMGHESQFRSIGH